MNTVLNMFGKGQITLPKKFRDKYKTKHFMASEVEGGILIQPIQVEKESVVFRNNKEEAGLTFSSPIQIEKFLKNLKKVCGEV